MTLNWLCESRTNTIEAHKAFLANIKINDGKTMSLTACDSKKACKLCIVGIHHMSVKIVKCKSSQCRAVAEQKAAAEGPGAKVIACAFQIRVYIPLNLYNLIAA